MFFGIKEEVLTKEHLPFVDLQPGDIMITSSNYTLGIRFGHVGLVINGETGLTLESYMPGQPSEYDFDYTWDRYPKVMLLRLKEEYRHLWQYVMMINPFTTEDEVLEIKELNEWDILIEFTNGKKVIFDKYTGYHKNIYYDNINELTEEQEKKEFAYRLRSLMGRKWVTQEELAKRVNTSQVMISRYVRGETLPSILMVRKIAKALGYSIDDFFDRDY